jgi:hypothetical protein
MPTLSISTIHARNATTNGGTWRAPRSALVEALHEVRPALRPAALSSAVAATAGVPIVAPLLIGGLMTYSVFKGLYIYLRGPNFRLELAKQFIKHEKQAILKKLKQLEHFGLPAENINFNRKIIGGFEAKLSKTPPQDRLKLSLKVIDQINEIENQHALIEADIDIVMDGIKKK